MKILKPRKKCAAGGGAIAGVGAYMMVGGLADLLMLGAARLVTAAVRAGLVVAVSVPCGLVGAMVGLADYSVVSLQARANRTPTAEPAILRESNNPARPITASTVYAPVETTRPPEYTLFENMDH
ncbi:MAG: hypothetical protein EOO38_15145 [Cytophagaceae bacterium]|nr:MAG: hypothetical protein EOO38_15145 [Cytophagaceae bacterium]